MTLTSTPAKLRSLVLKFSEAPKKSSEHPSKPFLIPPIFGVLRGMALYLPTYGHGAPYGFDPYLDAIVS